MNSSLGGNVTVSFSGSQVEVYDNIAKAILSKATFKSTDAITLDLPAGQANSVSVVLPATAGAAIPKEVLVEGVSGATNNQVTVVGTSGANTFTLAGSTVTANGLATQIAAVQKLTLNGGGGNDYYTLNSSAVPDLDRRYGRLQHGGLQPRHGGRDRQSRPRQGTDAVDRPLGHHAFDLRRDQQADRHGVCRRPHRRPGGDRRRSSAGAGNDTIAGGSGDNILLGGGGNDTIIGGQGRNLMIAGSGTCNLYANGSQNMVFAGSTNYDSNDQALLNLLERRAAVLVQL